jgi:hypothetical protein
MCNSRKIKEKKITVIDVKAIFWCSIFLFPRLVLAGEFFPSIFSFQNLGKNSMGILYSPQSHGGGSFSGFYPLGGLNFYFSSSGIRQAAIQKKIDLLGREFLSPKTLNQHYGIFGFHYKSFHLQAIHSMQEISAWGGGIGISITQNKSLYFQSLQNPERRLKEYRISFVGKGRLQLGLEFARRFQQESSEIQFIFSIQTNFEGVYLGAVHSSSDDVGNERNYLFSGYTFSESQEDSFWIEPNPYHDEDRDKEKPPIPPKKLFLKVPEEKKAPKYEFTLQELLAKKIPLGEAMQILQKAKNPEEFGDFLEKLPSSTKGKVYGLMKEKRKKGK